MELVLRRGCLSIDEICISLNERFCISNVRERCFFSMPIPNTKQQLSEAIQSNYERLRALLQNVPLNRTNSAELPGHSKGALINVHQLVSYLVGWGQLVLKWNQGREAGLPVDFPETGYRWNQLGALSQKFYCDYADVSFVALMDKFDETVSGILQLTDSKTETELYGVPWYGKHTLGRMIQLNTASPYKNAYARLRKWTKEHGVMRHR